MKFNRNLIRFFIAFIIVGMTLPFVSSIKAKADCLSADQVKELLMIATDGKEINQSWVDEILNGQTPDQLCIDEMKEALESADNAVDISNISVSGLEQTLEHFETGEDFISDVLKPVGRCVVALNAIKEARQGDIPGLVTVLSEAGLEELFSPTAPFFLAKDAGLVLSNYISKWYDNTIISNYIDHCMYCKEIGVSPWYSLYLTDTTPEEQEIIKSNLQKLADCIYEIETNTTLADSSTSQQYSVSMTPDSSWNELPGEVSFTASTSNAASSISEYKWYINNELVKDGTENNFSYNFSKIDTYQVAVKAIDSLGNETTGYGYENVNSPVHACLNCDHNADCPYGSPAHCTFNFDASLSSVENGWGSISKYNWTIKDNDGNIVVSEDSSSPKYSYTYYGDSTQKYYYAALTVYSDTGYKGTSESSIVIGSFGETDDDITTTINQDLVLSKSFSPYIYSSGVSYSTGFNSFIVDGADLTINPGVEATFEKGITVINGGSITVKDGATVNAPFIDIESGTLDVEGTESDTCTINSTVSCGKSTAKINYATIDTVSGTDSALDIQNSVIKQDVGTDNSSLKLINCALKQFSVDNATGTADIEGCHATGDSSIDAKAVNSAQQIIIKNNKFDSAVELFLQKGLLNQFDFEGNTGAGLILYGELDQQFNLDIGMPIQLGFQNNILSVIQGGDMTLKSDNISSSGLAVDGGSITFEEGSAISGPIDVSNGELKLLGTAEHPITASDIQATNSTVDIEYATISGSNTGIDGLFINGGTLQLENCDINTVFYLINITGSNAIEGNKFENSFWITQDDNNQQILMK
ncbi:MAG: PKD domain-containing protein, partial [Bacillota bacterium]|nr:PKD domain-containing protein [Bacillota bacterium]